MNDEGLLQLGEHIRHIRQMRGLTVRQVAATAGIDPGGLTRLEHGRIAEPRPTTLHGLATALSISLADLFAMAGYTVPRDLPSIRHYLRVKYDCLPEEIVDLLGAEVEHLAGQRD